MDDLIILLRTILLIICFQVYQLRQRASVTDCKLLRSALHVPRNATIFCIDVLLFPTSIHIRVGDKDGYSQQICHKGRFYVPMLRAFGYDHVLYIHVF